MKEINTEAILKIMIGIGKGLSFCYNILNSFIRMKMNLEELKKRQEKPIIAHIDHGKSTLKWTKS